MLVTRLNLAEQLLTELSMYCIDFPKLLGCKFYTIFKKRFRDMYFYNRKSLNSLEKNFKKKTGG